MVVKKEKTRNFYCKRLKIHTVVVKKRCDTFPLDPFRKVFLWYSCFYVPIKPSERYTVSSLGHLKKKINPFMECWFVPTKDSIHLKKRSLMQQSLLTEST